MSKFLWNPSDWLFHKYALWGSLAGVLAIASVILAAALSGGPQKAFAKWAVAVWSVIPPIYFFCEFHWARSKDDSNTLARVKESQELAGKVWAGVVAALSVLYLGKPE